MNQLSVYQLPIQGLPIQKNAVRSIKRVAGTPRDSVLNNKLSPRNYCTGLRDLNSIHQKL